jgi:hypothetical protein
MNYKIGFTLIAGLLYLTPIAANDMYMYKLLGEAPMGSKLRPVEVQSIIPFNKEYSQLTDQQRRIYRASLSLADDETPPFPKGGTRTLYKPLIKGHERVSRGGELTIIASINEKGLTEKVTVYHSPSKQITELVHSVFFATEFDPATCAGEPCKMDYQFEFKLRQRVKQMRTLNADDFG